MAFVKQSVNMQAQIPATPLVEMSAQTSTKERLLQLLIQMAEDETLKPFLRLQAARRAVELLQPAVAKKQKEEKVEQPPKKVRRKKDVLGLRSI